MFPPNNISHFTCVYYDQYPNPSMWMYWVWNFEKIELLVIVQRRVEMGEFLVTLASICACACPASASRIGSADFFSGGKVFGYQRNGEKSE